MHHCDQDHDFTHLAICLTILTQAPVTIQPAKRALDDPALWFDPRALQVGHPARDLQRPATQCPQPVRERLAVIADVRKPGDEPGEAPTKRPATNRAPVRSPTFAAVTTTTNSSPSVTTWRERAAEADLAGIISSRARARGLDSPASNDAPRETRCSLNSPLNSRTMHAPTFDR
jgi:hypothetical protein